MSRPSHASVRCSMDPGVPADCTGELKEEKQMQRIQTTRLGSSILSLPAVLSSQITAASETIVVLA